MAAVKRSATSTRAAWLFLAFAVLGGASCGNGRTSLGTAPRDAQADSAAGGARGDGSESQGDLRLPSNDGDASRNGGGDAGRVSDTGGGGGAGYAGAGGIGRGGAGGTRSGGSAGGGVVSGTAGTSSVAGSAGRGGISGRDGGVTTGGAAGAIPDGSADLRDGGPDTGTGADGRPRWRDSANNLCAPASVGSGSASVYSDNRNLFVMAWNSPEATSSAERTATIWTNDGSGWRTYFSWSKDAQFPSRFFGGTRAGIRGRPDGSLFAFGRFGCAIELIDAAGEHCSGALPTIADLFVSASNTPYATDGYCLLKYDGSMWLQVGERFPTGDGGTLQGHALWADDAMAVVGGNNGYILSIRGEKVVTVLPQPPEAYNIAGVWAWSANDIWAVTEGGDLHHYDGTQWTLKWKPTTYMGGGARLWGVAGHLFVVGYGEFAEWDGTALRSLLPSTQVSRQFTDVWGNSPTEVFATSVATPDAQIGSCNAVELWWYDGTTARTM